MVTISELFDIDYGQSLSLNRLKLSTPQDGVAFVSRTARNNGISAWVEKIPDVDVLPAGLLTVCLRSRNYTLSTFVQPRPFYCGYHIFVLRPKKAMQLKEKLWWAECIGANRYRYNFGRQANRSLAALRLPESMPDWVNSVSEPAFALTQNGVPEESLDSELWATYRFDEIFDVVRGHQVLRRNMRPGATAYVSALSINNGVSARTDLPPDHPAGAISVASNGNGVGSAFYQPQPFIASGDVTVLLPKKGLSAAAALFVCTIIYADKYRWNYGRKWTTSRIKESSIRLPADVSGDPNWEKMERYVSRLPLAEAVLPTLSPSS